MDEQVAFLMSIMNCDQDVALRYLTIADGDLPTALALMEANGDNGAPAATSAPLDSDFREGQTPSPHTPSPYPLMETDTAVLDRLTTEIDTSGDARLAQAMAAQWEGEPDPSPRLPRRELPNTVRDGAIVSFREACREATQRNLWLFIFFHDNSLPSFQAQTTLWYHQATDLLNEFVLCYDVCTERSPGRELAVDYKFTFPGPFNIIIVNPITQHKEYEVPTHYMNTSQKFDPEEVISTSVYFLANTSKPNTAVLPSTSEQRETSRDDDDDDVQHIPQLQQRNNSSEPVRKALPQHKVSSQAPPVHAPPSIPFPEPDIPSVLIEGITSLELFEALDNTEDGIKLRLQFPKSVLDIRLKTSTPVSAMLGYCANRLHNENREAYPTPPEKPSFLGGFPPRPLELPASPECTLGEWKAIRNGDKLIVKA